MGGSSKGMIDSCTHKNKSKHILCEPRVEGAGPWCTGQGVGCRGKDSVGGRCNHGRGRKRETLSITLQLRVCSERESIPES